ncbi:MAG TPA: glycosyltransferase family 4 protein [Tepidisphaeraceae bacterium]|nr:glycosyltransferase family 4 protein [Tepidisphaeraceae bacterium]
MLTAPIDQTPAPVDDSDEPAIRGSGEKARTRPLRLMYAAGPGDVIGTYRHWHEGRDDPGQVAMTYSGQFYDVCRDLGAKGYVLASHPRRETVRDGDFRVEHRTIPFIAARAPLYHLGQFWMGIRLSLAALRFGADALVICDGTAHWFALRMLPRLGVRVIPTLHCMLWRKSAPQPGRVQRIIRRLDRAFWKKSAPRILSASTDIVRQLDELTAGAHAPVIEFLPTYRPGTFAENPDPPESRTPFRVLFAGRIERYKGVFDLLEIAKRFAEKKVEIEFDLCGMGSHFEELKRETERAGLTSRFRLHGHLSRPQMREMFRECHVLVVPTTTDFIEGFNQVVVEGVLAGRPVITSNVCPAIEYVRDAVVEVPPNDVAAYQQAIERLHHDRELYEQKRRACGALQSQFYDPARGWAASLRRAIAECALG